MTPALSPLIRADYSTATKLTSTRTPEGKRTNSGTSEIYDPSRTNCKVSNNGANHQNSRTFMQLVIISVPHLSIARLTSSVVDPDPPDPHVFGTLFDFLSLKNDVNVASKSNKHKKLCKKISFLLASWRSMTKIAGSGSGSESGSIGQRHGSADPDPPQIVMDPQHWWQEN